MKFFARKLQKKIYPWLDNPDAIIILGARQAGKTSLLELLKKDLIKKWGAAKNIVTYNLEDSDQLAALNRDPKYFKEYFKDSCDPADILKSNIETGSLFDAVINTLILKEISIEKFKKYETIFNKEGVKEMITVINRLVFLKDIPLYLHQFQCFLK